MTITLQKFQNPAGINMTLINEGESLTLSFTMTEWSAFVAHQKVTLSKPLAHEKSGPYEAAS